MTTATAAATAAGGVLGALKPYGITGLVLVVMAGLIFVGEWQVVRGERNIVAGLAAQSLQLGELRSAIETHDAQSAERVDRIERELRLLNAGQNAICINAATTTEQVERCLQATEPRAR